MGVWVYQPYSAIQNGLFLLSVAVLVFGNYDLAELGRGVLERLSRLGGGGRSFVHAFGRRRGEVLQKKASLNE